jgi:YidC/Oxa1 family membrane protein insertase
LDTSRVLVAVILSLVLIFAYQELVLKRLYPPPSEPVAGKHRPTAVPSPEAAATAQLPLAHATAMPAPSAAERAAAPPSEILHGPPGVSPPPPRIITVSTDLYVAQFTTRGARLKSLRLKNYTETAAPKSGSYEMVPSENEGPLPLGVTLSGAGASGNDRELAYTSDAPERIAVSGANAATISFSAATAGGERITKTFTLRNGSYAFGMDVDVSGAAPDRIGLVLSQSLAEKPGGYRDIPELQADVNTKVVTESEHSLKKHPAPLTGTVTYAGFGDRYFLMAYLPRHPNAATLAMSYQGDLATTWLEFHGTARISSEVYMGPKLLEALEAVEPALSKAIDFGWTGLIAMPFLRTLQVFHVVSSNWGWDIILLTVALRVLLLPMSIKGQRSMLRMQRLQPQMERLRQKFKEDQERLQREMVELYKRNHVNPLGGCLPMVIQFPVFIGLYEALLNAIQLRHAPFIWWISDLSAPDCYPVSWMPHLPYIDCHGIPVLVLLMGASTFLQQWMSPRAPDPNQQRMMMLTPIIFTVLFVNFPAGLSLYYFASNVLGVIQQFFLNREFKQIPEPA